MHGLHCTSAHQPHASAAAACTSTCCLRCCCPLRRRPQVRQTAVSLCGSTILAACQDGSVHRWERQAPGGREDGQGGSEGGSEGGDEEAVEDEGEDVDEDMDE